MAGWLGPEDFMLTLDLKSSYHIGIRESDWQYLGSSSVSNSTCLYSCLSASPRPAGPSPIKPSCTPSAAMVGVDADAGILLAKRAEVLVQLEQLSFCVNHEKSLLGDMLVDTKRVSFRCCLTSGLLRSIRSTL